MKPSGVLHVIASMDPEKGGVGKAIRLIISGLESHNVRSEVLTFDPPDNPYCRNDEFKSYALGPLKSSWQYTEKFIPWLHDNLENYDAVILHGLWLYNSYALTKTIGDIRKNQKSGRTSKTKFFVMPHGMLDPYFQKTTTRKIKALRNWVYWKLIEHKTIANADGLLFTCEQEMLLAAQSFGPYKPKKEIIVGLGVEEPPKYSNAMKDAFIQKTGWHTEFPYFLFLGRIHDKKGVDILIDAYAQLAASSHSNDEFKSNSTLPKLVIAGPELETTFGKKMFKTVSENPFLKDNIVFTGMLSGDSKWGAFYGCDAFILPSHQENFGIAVVEALACSKPVLISNQVNIWREIKNSGGGLVEEDSFNGVLKMLQHWNGKNVQEKKIMQLGARKGFETHFSGDVFAKNIILSIYNLSASKHSVVS